MAGFLLHHFATPDFDHAWAIVALARGMKKIVAGESASMVGRYEGTATSTFPGGHNSRFCHAVTFAVKPYSYPDDDSITRWFTKFLMSDATRAKLGV